MAIISALVAAAGSSQATATELLSQFNQVTGADGSVGVRLSDARLANRVYVYNPATTSGLKVYPHAGGDINDGTQNAAVVIEGKSLAVFVCLDGTTWGAQYTADT